ncbi:N-lysine methyltransferase KMT5A [Nymphon striatum]|nr:N-lysine methyltransferase KMT5A [Nymphon striatum]
MKGRRKKNQMMTSSSEDTAIKKEVDPTKQLQSPITSYFSPNNWKNIDNGEKCVLESKNNSVDENTDAEVKENFFLTSNIPRTNHSISMKLGNFNGTEKFKTVKKKLIVNSKELKKHPKCLVKDHTDCKQLISNKAQSVVKVSETSKNRKYVKPADNKQITEYFPIRRSDRKTKRQIQYEQQEHIKKILLSETDPSHLHICEFEGKGRGVVTSKFCKRGEFVVEYSGELIDPETAKYREFQYGCDDNIGCYMYYFTHNDKQYCLDATAETNRLGRLINHSKKDGNLITKTFVVNKIPRLILMAKRDIFEKEEILYDYGDRRNSSLQNHPWLAE